MTMARRPWSYLLPDESMADDEAKQEALRLALLDLGWFLVDWDPENVSRQFQQRDGSRLLIAAETHPVAMRILLVQVGD